MPTAIRASCRTANNFISAGPTVSGPSRSVRSAPAVIIRPRTTATVISTRPAISSWKPMWNSVSGLWGGWAEPYFWMPGISGCSKRSEPSGRRAQMARFLQRDRARNRVRAPLRHQLPGIARRSRHCAAHPYPNPDKPGYYNISKFKDGLGFHVAIGYPF